MALSRTIPSTQAFDPLQNLFLAQDERPPNVEAVNLRALTPFQRALLVIDGTVTKFIEAYMMEPVSVERLSQTYTTLERAYPWLAAQAGTRIISRTVLLVGDYSRTVYAYAASLILPSRVGQHVEEGLHTDHGSLGRLLLGDQVESYRDVLWYGRERIASLPESLATRIGHTFLTRTYRIIADGHPLMMITERFPLEHDFRPRHE
nr:chorismate pyruvate-lyase family protein [Ardenticatena sp.]